MFFDRETHMSFNKYLFIDRDGTLIEEPSDFQIDTIEKFKLVPDVIPSLLLLQKAGYRMIMISNQDGLGTETYPQDRFDLIQTLLIRILESQGIQIESVRICPHFERDHCFCRKPNIGLVKDFLSSVEMDRQNSFVIGDRLTDLALAENMGIPGIQISPERGWKSLAAEIVSRPRKASFSRMTKETQIAATLNLDLLGTNQISTGIGFFDHMLEQLAYHGGFHLVLNVKGDLHIDEHHTVEDTAITLGSALKRALGDKIGIQRFGFYLPMDEASTQVTLDLSGRSYFRFEGQFSRDRVGTFPTEMVPHFFRSFSESLGATLHIKVEGENTHHQIESIFKAVGRSLRTAVQSNDSSGLPSTKGTL